MVAKVGFASYAPGVLGSDSLPALAAALQAELGAIAATFDTVSQGVILTLFYAEPARPRPLMLVYADGTSWNPGSGAGVYVRDVANAVWKFLG